MKTRSRTSLNGRQSPQSKGIGRTVPKCSYSNKMHCEETKRRSTSSSVKSSKPSSQYKTCKSMSQTNIDLYSTSPQHRVWSSLKRTSTPFVLGENGDENISAHGETMFKIIDDEISFNLNSSRHFLIESTANESQGGTRPRRSQEMKSKTNLLKRGRDGGMDMLEMQPPNKKSKRTSSTHQSNELNPIKKIKKTISINPIKDNQQQKESLLLSSNSKTKKNTMNVPTAKLLTGKKKLQNSMNGPTAKLLTDQKNLQNPKNGPNAKILTGKKKLQNSMNEPNAKLLTGKKKLRNSMNGPTAKLLTGKEELRKTESRISKTSLRTLSFSRVGNSDHTRLRKRNTNSVKSTTSQKIDRQLKGLPTPQEVCLNKTPDSDVTSSHAKKISRTNTSSKLIRTAPTQTKKSTSTARKSSQTNNTSDLQKYDRKTRLEESLKKTDIVVIKKSKFQERAINLSRRRNSQNKTRDSQMLKKLLQVSVENKKYAILKRRTFPTKKSTNKSSLRSDSHKSATKTPGRTGRKIDTFESVQEILEKKTRSKNAGCGAKQSVVNGKDKMAFYDTNNLHDEQTNLINDTIREENNENSQYFSPTMSGSLMAPSKALRRTKQSPTTQSAREIIRKTLKSTKDFIRADGKKQKTRNRLTIVKKADRLLPLSVNRAGEENKPTKEIGEKTISASRNEKDTVKSKNVSDTSSARRSLFAEQTKQASSAVSKPKHTPNQDTTQKRYFGYRTFPIIITNNQSTNTSASKSFPDRVGHFQDIGNKRITSQRNSERLSSSSHNLSAGANMPFGNLTQSGKLLRSTRSSLVHNDSIVVPLASQINKLKGTDVDVVATKSQDKKQGKSQSLTLVTRSSEERKEVSPLLVHQKTRRSRVRKIMKKSFKTANRTLRSNPRSSTPNKRDTTLSSPLKVIDKTQHTPAGQTHTITVSASKKQSDGSELTKVDVEVKVVKQRSTRSTTAVRHGQMEQISSKLAKSLQERSTQTSFEIFTPSPIAVRTPQHRRKSTQTDAIISNIIESADKTNFANIIESTEQTDFANFMKSTEQTQSSTKVNTRSEEIISKRAKNLGTINANTHKKKRLDSAISTNDHVDKLKEKLSKSKRLTQFKRSARVQDLASLSLLHRKDKLKVTSLSQSAPSLNEMLSSSKKQRNSLRHQSNESTRFLKGDLILTQKQKKSINYVPAPKISPKETLSVHTNPANCLTTKSKEKVSVIHMKMLSEKKPSRGNNLNKVAPNEVVKRAPNANVRKTFEENLANHTQFKKSPRITNRLSLSSFEKIGQTVPLKQNKLNENSLKQNLMKQNSREEKPLKQNALKQNTLKHNSLKHNSLKHNSLKHNSLKHNSLKQNALKQNALKQKSLKHNSLKHNSLKHNSLKHNSLKQNALKQNALKHNSLKHNSLKHNSLKQNALKQNALKQKSLKQNALKQKSLKQSALKQKSLKQNSRVRRQIKYSLVKLIFSDKNSVSHSTLGKNSKVILPKTQQTPKIRPKTEKAVRELLTRSEKLPLTEKCTESTSNQHSTPSSSLRKKRNIDNAKKEMTFRSKRKKSKTKANKPTSKALAKKQAHKKNNRSLPSLRKTASNLSRVKRLSLNILIKPAIKQSASMKAQGKKLANQNIPSSTLTCALATQELDDLNKNVLLQATHTPQESKTPLTAKKLEGKIIKTPPSTAINKNNINAATQSTGSISIKAKERNSKPRRSEAGGQKSLSISMLKLSGATSPLLKTRQSQAAIKVSAEKKTRGRKHTTEAHNMPSGNHKSESHNLPMKTHENANKVLNNAENKNNPIDSSQKVTCTSQPKTRRHKNQQKASSRKIFIPASSITDESQKRIRGISHGRNNQTNFNFKTGRKTRSAIDLREKDLPHLQKQPKSQILTPIKRFGPDLHNSYKRPTELTRKRLSQKKSKLKTVGVKPVLPKLVVTESSPTNSLALDVNYDHLLSRYSVQHENPLISIHAEEAESDIDLPKSRETFESDYGRRMLRMLCREEVLKSPYRRYSDKLVDDFDDTLDSSLYDISQDDQNGDLDRDEMLKYISQEKSDVDEFPNFQLEERTTDSFQDEVELYENHSIITDASYQNDIDDFEGLIPIDHASQSQHCTIS